MPKLNKLKAQYGSEKVAFVSFTTEDSTKVNAFFKNPKHRFDYTHLIENPGTVDFLEMLNTDTTLKFAETNTIPVNLITYHDKIVYYNIGADEENIHRMDSVLKKYTGLNP